MNGCTFLREKGEELHWNHAKLFPYFKSKIEPYMIGVEDRCRTMLNFFHYIRNYDIKLTASIERHYEIFIDMYHYQQFIETDETLIPSAEVQLMWITHCLHPVEYYRDCQAKYKKILDVNIMNMTNQYSYDTLHAHSNNQFEEYLNRKLNSTTFAPITTSLKTLTSNTSMTTKDSQETWFIHNLHMKNSMIQQVEFIKKVNFVQLHNKISANDIQKAMRRYYKFLYIMALPSNKRAPICMPTLDIDLVWHSHILNFKSYYAMSRYLFPQIEIIPHNHSMQPSQQNRNKQLTQIFWDKIFGSTDYLNGRPFYILYHKKDGDSVKKKRIKRKSTPRRPRPPVVLQEDNNIIEPSMECMASLSPLTCIKERSITITRLHSADPRDETHEISTTTTALCVQDSNDSMNDRDINTQMLMKGENDTNCGSVCELCTDCCRWSFKSYQQESVYIICSSFICVVFVFILLGIFVFIPKAADGFTVNLYQNSVVINSDASISIDTLMVYELESVLNHENKALHWYKSIAYNIDGITNDIIHFKANTLVSSPYVEDNNYYVDMNMNMDYFKDKSKAFMRLNYTLSPSYFCCNNAECNEIGLFMPWINQWPHKATVDQFNMNIFHHNMSGLMSVSSSWNNGKSLDGFYSVSTNQMAVETDLSLYFTLLYNSTLVVNNTMEECGEQLKYFMDEGVEREDEENENETLITVTDFVLLAISTALFVICTCFGCWWMMYLYDNSVCCDLCSVVVAK